MISRFNKVSGYDFNTLKEWKITPDAVTERTDSMHLGMAYDRLLTAVILEEECSKLYINDGSVDSEISYYLDRAKFQLVMYQALKDINDSPLMNTKY